MAEKIALLDPGKIEALVEKMDMSSERLAEVIAGVLGAHFGGGDHERT